MGDQDSRDVQVPPGLGDFSSEPNLRKRADYDHQWKLLIALTNAFGLECFCGFRVHSHEGHHIRPEPREWLRIWAEHLNGTYVRDRCKSEHPNLVPLRKYCTFETVEMFFRIFSRRHTSYVINARLASIKPLNWELMPTDNALRGFTFYPARAFIPAIPNAKYLPPIWIRDLDYVFIPLSKSIPKQQRLWASGGFIQIRTRIRGNIRRQAKEEIVANCHRSAHLFSAWYWSELLSTLVLANPRFLVPSYWSLCLRHLQFFHCSDPPNGLGFYSLPCAA